MLSLEGQEAKSGDLSKCCAVGLERWKEDVTGRGLDRHELHSFRCYLLPDTARAVRKGVGEPVTKGSRDSLPEALTGARNKSKLRSDT